MAKTSKGKARRSGEPRNVLSCGYCRASIGEMKPCGSCGKMFCDYHLDPQSHACENPEPQRPKRDEAKGDLLDTKITLSDLLKLGAIAAIILIAAKFGAWFISFLKDVYGKAKLLFKAPIILAGALALATLWATMVPGLASQLGFIWENAERVISLMPLPKNLPSNTTIGYQTPDPTLAYDLHKCVKTMVYSGPQENYTGQKCVALCKERKYVSYGIVKGVTSYDCYCCAGT